MPAGKSFAYIYICLQTQLSIYYSLFGRRELTKLVNLSPTPLFPHWHVAAVPWTIAADVASRFTNQLHPCGCSLSLSVTPCLQSTEDLPKSLKAIYEDHVRRHVHNENLLRHFPRRRSSAHVCFRFTCSVVTFGTTARKILIFSVNDKIK